MIMRHITLMFLIVSLLISCNPSKKENYSFSEAEKTFEADPSNQNLAAVLSAYNQFISENRTNSEELIPVLNKALEVVQEHQPNLAPVYINSLLRTMDPNDPSRADYLYKLGTYLNQANKKSAGTVVLASLVNNYPDFEKSEELADEYNDQNPMAIINGLASARMENPDQFGINKNATFAYVDACEAYALANPNDPKTPELIFDAAEMAKLLKTTNKALDLYDWLVVSYPNYKKSPAALFIKAFVLENEVGNIDLAKATYEEFLEKYPNDDFADDAKFSLENIGKSPEEVLKMIDQGQQAQ